MKYVFPYASTLVGLWIDDVIEDMELGRCLSGSSMLERMLEFGLSTSSAEEVDSATEDASEGHEWTLVPRLGARKEIPTIRGGGAVGWLDSPSDEVDEHADRRRSLDWLPCTA